MGRELAGSRVLVTGGSGFIGSHIVDQLMDEGVAEVVVIDDLIRGRRDNLAGAEARGQVTFVEGSISDAALVREHMRGMDYVYHQAALRITHCAAEPRAA
ncbi:MAG TPA: NAD-dependent epimerase/dehydratase family protein, partial [Ktedonobacterales bacterium]|nr:NAD-dependent epimerase/dehydratase family protein [Ktedonobacterales bacterium]